jgi:hypothetical protein
LEEGESRVEGLTEILKPEMAFFSICWVMIKDVIKAEERQRTRYGGRRGGASLPSPGRQVPPHSNQRFLAMW